MQEHTVKMENAATLGGDLFCKRLNGRTVSVGIRNPGHGSFSTQDHAASGA